MVVDVVVVVVTIGGGSVVVVVVLLVVDRVVDEGVDVIAFDARNNALVVGVVRSLKTGKKSHVWKMQTKIVEEKYKVVEVLKGPEGGSC